MQTALFQERLAGFGRLVGVDPRLYQIISLALLLVYGKCCLGFEVGASQIVLVLAAALCMQLAFTRTYRLPMFDARSALISGLSLCLLLRTNSPLLAAATAFATIASKFVLRWNGKHIFNPTNFGLVLGLLLMGNSIWVSPGQWGSVAFFAFLLACLGGLVTQRAGRADVTLSFLGFYCSLVFGR